MPRAGRAICSVGSARHSPGVRLLLRLPLVRVLHVLVLLLFDEVRWPLVHLDTAGAGEREGVTPARRVITITSEDTTAG